MKRKQLIILLLCITAITAAGIWYGIYLTQREKENVMLHTNGTGYAEDDDIPHADPLIVGKWKNDVNPQWFKVYYDDYDEDEGFFWGKEWDESEDVREEDLNYHGNGWFLWKTEGKMLIELHNMDVRNVKVPKTWMVQHLSTCAAVLPNDSLILVDKNYKTHRFHFTKQCQY